MTSYAAGWDYFTPDFGEVEKMCCKVCGQEMSCKRGVNGSTSFIEAMGGFKRLHDVFKCKYSQENWHQRVLRMRIEAEKTGSNKLKEMLEGEIVETIKEGVTYEKE